MKKEQTRKDRAGLRPRPAPLKGESEWNANPAQTEFLSPNRRPFRGPETSGALRQPVDYADLRARAGGVAPEGGGGAGPDRSGREGGRGGRTIAVPAKIL